MSLALHRTELPAQKRFVAPFIVSFRNDYHIPTNLILLGRFELPSGIPKIPRLDRYPTEVLHIHIRLKRINSFLRTRRGLNPREQISSDVLSIKVCHVTTTLRVQIRQAGVEPASEVSRTPSISQTNPHQQISLSGKRR